MLGDDENYLKDFFRSSRSARAWLLAVFCLFFLFSSFYAVCIRAPDNFPTKEIITIENSATLSQIAQTLKDKRIVRSPFWFKLMTVAFYGEKSVMAGDYFFKKKINLIRVSNRLANGNFGLALVKITFPEGSTVKQMSAVLNAELINFSASQFMELAKMMEGYLFPDTYFFMQNSKPELIVATLRSNFNLKIKTIDDKIKIFGKPLKDIVTMASIIEAEARTTETRKVISGILWKRLAIGLPLQVDAPFQYIIGKNTFQLTTNDLKFDSPYNTYKYKGLPPAPIGNPGLDAMIAAVTPKKSPYLFYLSDIRGNMHYAKTFEEHVANKERYLR